MTTYPSFNTPIDRLLGGQDDFGSYLATQARGSQGVNPRVREDIARKQGWQVPTGGGQATRGIPFTHGTEYMPITAFNPPQGENLNLPPMLLKALLTDTRAMQGAANEQWGRNNDQISGLDSWLQGMPGRLSGQAGSLSGDLLSMAGRAEGMGGGQLAGAEAWGRGIVDATHRGVEGYQQGLDRVSRDIGGVVPKLDQARGDVDKGYALGDQAVAGFEGAIKDYEDRTAQDASVVAAGIRRNAGSAMRMVRSGIHPDGTPMTSGEQASAMAQIQREVGDQVQSAVTPIFSEYNRTKTQLQTTLAQLRTGNAQMRLSGAGVKDQLAETELKARWMQGDLEKAKLAGTELESQVGLAVGDQMLKAQAGQREMMNLSAGLHQTAANLEQTSLLESVRLEMQGRTQMAQFVQQNPRSVVSWFQSLLSLYSVRAGATGNTKLG